MNNASIQLKEDSYIFFTVGNYNYAFSTNYVSDIMQLVELEYPESMPDFIAGILKYNEQVIKIIDIKEILKIERSPYDLNSKIIIVKAENDIFGIIADEVLEIRQISANTFNSTPYDKEISYLEAVYTDKNISSAILNLKNISKKINSKQTEVTNSIKAPVLLPKGELIEETLHRRRLHYEGKNKAQKYEIITSKDTYVTFFLNNNICCIKIISVVGFYKCSNIKLTKVPCTPDFIKGIENVKGRYITIIDLLKFTENKDYEIKKDGIVIVIEYEDYQLGIIADGIGETIDIDEGVVNHAINKSTSCLSEFVLQNKLYMFLDAKKLFEDEKLYVS